VNLPKTLLHASATPHTKGGLYPVDRKGYVSFNVADRSILSPGDSGEEEARAAVTPEGGMGAVTLNPLLAERMRLMCLYGL
jgi:hypothetical protein